MVLPHRPGVGFKPQHYAGLTGDPGPVEWVEVHAENYMGDGGRALAQLASLRDRFALSVHGVGLSIGGEGRLDGDHLSRVRRVCERFEPASFSEHLAWSTHEGVYFNDLLPLPYREDTLARTAAHVQEVQEALARPILIENPSVYVTLPASEMDEIDFLTELAARTGCGLLLDVNNVLVSATNRQTDPLDYIDRFPHALVGEIHLGGHAVDADERGAPLLIDDHAHPVAPQVWALLDRTLALAGPQPVLIEWDNDLPDWPTLRAEAARAGAALDRAALDALR
jgi:uncharacterized protein (UPF0276 family)